MRELYQYMYVKNMHASCEHSELLHGPTSRVEVPRSCTKTKNGFDKDSRELAKVRERTIDG